MCAGAFFRFPFFLPEVSSSIVRAQFTAERRGYTVFLIETPTEKLGGKAKIMNKYAAREDA